MTIPITPPGIGVTGVVPSDVERLLAHVLQGSEIGQRQQQLDTEKERLKMEQQAHKDAQTQHAQEVAQLAQLGEVARALILGQQPQTMLPGGSLPGMPQDVNLGATSPFAQMLQQLPAQSVPALIPLLSQVGGLQGQAATTTGQQLTNVERAKGLADDRAISRIVAGLESQPLTQATIGRVITAVAAINPQKASALASSLAPLVPNFTAHINPNGSVSWVSNRPGGVAGAPVQAAPGDVDQRKAAGYARRILEANATMTSLENSIPGIGQDIDDVLRRTKGLGNLALVGRSLESLFTPSIVNQLSAAGIPVKQAREYMYARIDMGNAILRRESGATINAEELDRETAPYVPMQGMGEDVIPSIQQRRLGIGLQYADQAGVEFRPDRLTPRARRYLLRAMTGQPVEPDAAPRRIQRPGETITPRPTPGDRF